MGEPVQVSIFILAAELVAHTQADGRELESDQCDDQKRDDNPAESQEHGA